MANTKIEWCNKVWNPVTGCTKVSAGCKNCYAETIANRFWKARQFTDVKYHEDRLKIPFSWKKPQRIFVNSMSDLFHKDVPDEFILRVFKMMSKCDWHTFLVLTKRPERMNNFMGFYWNETNSPTINNIWLGVSVENQKTADERIPILLNTSAAIRFVSYEPALELVNLEAYLREIISGSYINDKWVSAIEVPKLDWIICGGESGYNARPFNPQWARQLLSQCRIAGIKFFMKQIDKKTPIPDDLMIREFPSEKI